MREIKFRAWVKPFGHFMFCREFFTRFMYGFITLESDGGGADENLKSDDFILQQFTGLFDKNGKEIYEGDILNWESNSISHRLGECKRIRIVEVRWDQERAAFITCEAGHKGIVPTWKMDANDFNGKPFIKEVIGNVFENKELLQS